MTAVEQASLFNPDDQSIPANTGISKAKMVVNIMQNPTPPVSGSDRDKIPRKENGNDGSGNISCASKVKGVRALIT